MSGEPTFEVVVVVIGALFGGGVIVTSLKLAWDNARDAGATHDKAFDKGFMSRDAEIDGLRRSFEHRFAEMERELKLLRTALVKLIGWVKDEHREEAFALMMQLGMPLDESP